VDEIVTVLTTIEQLEAQGHAARPILDRVKRDCRAMLDERERGQERERLRAEGRLARLCAAYPGQRQPAF
jgi:hypothetical protein